LQFVVVIVVFYAEKEFILSFTCTPQQRLMAVPWDDAANTSWRINFCT